MVLDSNKIYNLQSLPLNFFDSIDRFEFRSINGLSETTLNQDQIKLMLAGHPDRTFVERVVAASGQDGTEIGFEGDWTPRIAAPRQLTAEKELKLFENISEGLRKGWVAGPWDINDPTKPAAIYSPADAVPKKGTTKLRAIHDLSEGNPSVNDGIDPDMFSPVVGSFAQALILVAAAGRGCILLIMDIASAYSNIRISRRSIMALGFIIGNLCFIEGRLPFGLRSSPAIWQDLMNALLWITNTFNPTPSVNFVDDTLFVNLTMEEAIAMADVFRKVCKLCGVPISEAKTVMGTEAQFLGFIINTVSWSFYLSTDTRLKYLAVFKWWADQSTVSLKQVQGLHGIVTHLSPAYPGGKSFTRRIAEFLGATKDRNRMRLTDGILADVQFWITALSVHRNMSITPRTFIGSSIEFWSDATPFGGGAIVGNNWWACDWESLDVSRHDIDKMPEKTQITFFELLAVVMSCATWAHNWNAKLILSHCDNEGVVKLIDTRYSRHPPAMALLRRLFYLELEFDFRLTCIHIAGVDNKIADAISRKEWKNFRKEAPNANPYADRCKWDKIRTFGSFDLMKGGSGSSSKLSTNA